MKKIATRIGLSAGKLAIVATMMTLELINKAKAEGRFRVGEGQVADLTISGSPLEVLVANMVNVILTVVGVAAVLYLIYGGVIYVTAGGDAEKASKGRVTITNAIIGIVIIFLSLAIYNYIVGNLGA